MSQRKENSHGSKKEGKNLPKDLETSKALNEAKNNLLEDELMIEEFEENLNTSVDTNQAVKNKDNSEKEFIDYTSNEELKEIEVGDMSVDITGFVDDITSSKVVGNKNQYTVMNFILNNDQGTRCQFAVWNKEVPRMQPYLQLKNVLHIEGAKAGPFKDQKYNAGNTNYELRIKQNTKVTKLSEKELNTHVEEKSPKLVQFKDLEKENGLIKINGFIKTSFEFLEYEMKDEPISYGVGSVADGELKVEIRIKEFRKEDRLFKKGQHVEVQGIVKCTKKTKIVYLSIQNSDFIKVIDDSTMDEKKLFNSYKYIKTKE